MDYALAIQLFSTLSMVGVIWLIQLVHYPLLAQVGDTEFPDYHQSHMFRISFVVGPLMLAESFSAVYWAYYPPAVGAKYAWIGIFLLAIIWVATAALSVPLHHALEKRFTALAHRLLVYTNWIRTFAWTARGLMVTYIATAS